MKYISDYVTTLLKNFTMPFCCNWTKMHTTYSGLQNMSPTSSHSKYILILRNSASTISPRRSFIVPWPKMLFPQILTWLGVFLIIQISAHLSPPQRPPINQSTIGSLATLSCMTSYLVKLLFPCLFFPFLVWSSLV